MDFRNLISRYYPEIYNIVSNSTFLASNYNSIKLTQSPNKIFKNKKIAKLIGLYDFDKQRQNNIKFQEKIDFHQQVQAKENFFKNDTIKLMQENQ